MVNVFNKKLLINFVCLMLFLLPQNLFAADLTFKLVPSVVNDRVDEKTAIVEVWVDPRSKKLNVVEGTIKLDGIGAENLSVEVLNDKSVLKIWPTIPVYIKKEKTISFTGGVPNGFDNKSLLLAIQLTPITLEDINISWISGTAYLNDGKGTKDAIIANDLLINEDILTKEINNLSQGKSSQYNVILLIISIIIFVALFIYVQKKK